MFRVNGDTAELMGVVLGDGNIYIKKGNNHELTIILNRNELRYARTISKLIRSVVFERPTIGFVRNKNALRIRLQKKTPVNNLITLGVDSGNRISKQSGIPDWIFRKDTFAKRCLRGLIDTDGSVYRLKPHWPNLKQLSFKSNNRKLLSDTRNLMILLGFHPSKIFGNRVVMTRQEEINRYFKEIGTNNSKYSPVV